MKEIENSFKVKLNDNYTRDDLLEDLTNLNFSDHEYDLETSRFETWAYVNLFCVSEGQYMEVVKHIKKKSEKVVI